MNLREAAQRVLKEARLGTVSFTVPSAAIAVLSRALADAPKESPAMLKAAPVPGREEVRVNPLEWRWRDHLDGGQFDADCPLGRYKVWGAKFSVWQWSTHLGRSDLKNYVSADQAKAAAQADYETRILSALFAAQPASDDALAKMTAERDAALAREHNAHLAVKEERAIAEAALSERDALREALKAEREACAQIATSAYEKRKRDVEDWRHIDTPHTASDCWDHAADEAFGIAEAIRARTLATKEPSHEA